MGFNKLLALDKHSARPAAGVINSAAVGFNHLDKDSYYASWGIELAAALAFSICKPAEEILVNSAKDVFTAALLIPKADCAHKVDQLTQALLVKPFPCIVLREHAFQGAIVPLYCGHSVVYGLSYSGLLCTSLQMVPAGLRRHPEDIFCKILFRIFRVGSVFNLR